MMPPEEAADVLTFLHVSHAQSQRAETSAPSLMDSFREAFFNNKTQQEPGSDRV